MFEEDRTAGVELFLVEEFVLTVADLLLVLVLLFVTLDELRVLLDEVPKTEFAMFRAASLEKIPLEEERVSAVGLETRFAVAGVLFT